MPTPPRVSDVKSGRPGARPGPLPLSGHWKHPEHASGGRASCAARRGTRTPAGLSGGRVLGGVSIGKDIFAKTGGPASPTVAPGPRTPAPRGIPKPGACRRCIVPCTRTHAHARTHARTQTHTHPHTHTNKQTNRSDTELKLFPVTRATAFGRQKRPPNLGRAHSPFELESDRPPCAALLAAPPKAGGEGFASRGQPIQRCTVHVAGALDLNDAAPAAPKSFSARTAAPRLAPRRTPTSRYSLCATPAAQHASSSAHSRRSQASAHSAAGPRCMQHTSEVQRRQQRHPSETRCQRRCPSCSDVIVCKHCRPSARP